MKRGRALTRRKGLAPGTVALKRRRLPGFRPSTLAARSPQRAEEDQRFSLLVAELRRERPWCEARLTEPCRRRPSRSYDPHHSLPLGRGGRRFDRANIVMVCRPCHDYMTHTVQGQREARQRGLTIGKELLAPT